ncbi:MAG: hypothetical protein K9M55_12110 [Candidatus Marinimicrobia bacterium]|nr:hypothetical protein [Candidatus Neomarinimicrobiota bacterium]
MRASKIFIVIAMVMILQSCYTMLYPPQTLPQTVTSVVSEPAMVSTVGGAGMYGWDPYWEPALPFTSYHYGYGASYYSPYNYYDYHHPHYAPVYVVSETRQPAPARDFNRDENQGGSRVRDLNVPPTTSSSGSKAGPVGQGSSMSTAAPAIIAPIITNPVTTPPPTRKTRTQAVKNMPSDPPAKQYIPIKVKQAPPVKQEKETENSDPPPAKKRTRTRK